MEPEKQVKGGFHRGQSDNPSGRQPIRKASAGLFCTFVTANSPTDIKDALRAFST
jgi:hypothetical protein